MRSFMSIFGRIRATPIRAYVYITLYYFTCILCIDEYNAIVRPSARRARTVDPA